MPEIAPVALITGSAQRLGACTARHLHQRGWNVLIHHRSRPGQAADFAADLNGLRADSAQVLQADLTDPDAVENLAHQAISAWGRLDALVNNASVFYPTPTDTAGLDDWNTLMHSNLRGPFLLGKACLTELRSRQGSITNLIDIYSERPLADHPLYCASKAGLAALTRSWAKDLAPDIRVNGVSPGAILWPENGGDMDTGQQQAILDKTPLQRTGDPDDIAGAITYLVCDAPFITGQVLSVDGGRSLNL